MGRPKISLVIPAYNEEKYIRPTLDAVMQAKQVYETTFSEGVEVIVVDNDSTDTTAMIAQEYGCNVIDFAQHNIAAVRNAGAAQAQGEYLAFVDADASIIPEDTFVSIHTNLEQPEVFGGGSRMRPDKLGCLCGFFGFGLLDLLTYYVLIDLQGLGLVLFYLRKKDFEEMNGFDETLYAFEDGEFGIRMKQYAQVNHQRLVHLKKPVIVSTRKNQLCSFSQMWRSYFKLYNKDGARDMNNVYEMLYDVDHLR